MADTAGDVHVGPPPDDDPPLSPMDQALRDADAELAGDDDEEGADQPGADEPVAEGDDEGDDEELSIDLDAIEGDDDEDEPEAGDQQGQDDDEVDAEGDEELDDDEVVIELPDSLKEQGYEDVVVSKGQEALFRALTNSYESTEERQAAEDRLGTYEQELLDEAEEFRLVAATDPYRILEGTFGEPEELEQSLHLYLMNDPHRWRRHKAFMESIGDDEDEAKAAKERLEFAHEKRTHKASVRLEKARKGREAGRMATQRIVKILDQIAPEDREFVKERLFHDVRAAAARRLEDTGSDIIEPAHIDKIARPWLERFGVQNGGEGGDGKKKKPKADQVAETEKKLRRKAKARKRAKKQSPSSGGSPPGGATRIPKGTKLDDVLKGLKAGKLG